MDHLLQQAELNSSCHQAGGDRNALPARIICFIIKLICQLTLPRGNERSNYKDREICVCVCMHTHANTPATIYLSKPINS